LSWCKCKEKTEKRTAWPREAKAQQSNAWAGDLESTAKEGGSQREVRRTFKMLREVWLNIGVRATEAQDSRRILSNITDCGYDTTHLQKNPQRLG